MTPNPQDSAVALEVERAIREALDAGPTPGPWRVFNHSWSDTSILAADFDHAVCLLDINYATEESQDADEAVMAANARLIAACNPEAMRTLLAEIDRLRASQSDGTSGGWISVDTRLPAHEQEVICSGFEGNDPTKKRWQEFAVFHRDGLFYNRETGDEYYPPTHWREMPVLPAAPNQGENHVG